MPINTTTPVYRFDLPSISSYSGGFSSDDSQTQIKTITVSNSDENFNATLLKVEGGNVEFGGNLSVDGNSHFYKPVEIIGGILDISGVTIKNYKEEEEERLFDTLVIRYPTQTGQGRFRGIREIQLWVNNVNVLPSLVTPSTFNVNGTSLADISNIPFFMDWSDKTLDPYHSTSYPSNVANDSFSSEAYWGIQNQLAVTNKNISLYIPLSTSININQIQSVIIYDRFPTAGDFVGTAVELYNRTNDPNLNQILASTNIITTNANVYRFDFGGIGTYNKEFVSVNSITNIMSNTHALTETTATNRSVLKIENAGLSVDGNVAIGTGLSVTGITTLSGALNANGGITGDNFIVADGTGNTSIGGTLDVIGTTTLTGTLNANGGITGDNFIVADGTGNTSIGGTLGVTNTTTLTGNVGIGGASGSHKLLVNGSERVTVNLDVSGELAVTGTLNANGGISGDNFVVADGTGNTSIGGTLGVTNTTTMTGNVGIGGASGSHKLLVTGSERVTENLDVSGDLVVTGSFKVEDGNTELGRNLNVSEIIYQTGASWSLSVVYFTQTSSTNVRYNKESAIHRNCTYTSSTGTITITKPGRYFVFFTFITSPSGQSGMQLLINGSLGT
jgi:hypothetical protein